MPPAGVTLPRYDGWCSWHDVKPDEDHLAYAQRVMLWDVIVLGVVEFGEPVPKNRHKSAERRPR